MRERNPQEVNGTAAIDSQALFLATFPEGHEPKIDTRTPQAVKEGLSPQEWKELNG